MRYLSAAICSLLVLSSMGCSGDTGFSRTKDDPGSDAGEGKIEISPASLEFTDLAVGYARTEYLLVKSVGDDTLSVYDLRVISGAGTFQTPRQEDFTIAVGDQIEVAVTATLKELSTVKGTLRIESNDRETLEYDIPLLAVPGDPSDTGDTGDTEDSGA